MQIFYLQIVLTARRGCLFVSIRAHAMSNVVSLAAVFWAVTQRFFWGERCVTAQKTAARETMSNDVVLQSKDFVACLWAVGDYNGFYDGLF